jgi:alkanesulfonate monooxygenase SsuD/methylene tetrahydromethanopterin reductase-like flavin-dependent oxidoreductase (luciferase family)
MELGPHTFADVAPKTTVGEPLAPVERIKNLIEEIELADQVGLDVFGVGEHHRPRLRGIGSSRSPRRSRGSHAAHSAHQRGDRPQLRRSGSDPLFAEKIELLLKVRERERVTSAGGHRAPGTCRQAAREHRFARLYRRRFRAGGQRPGWPVLTGCRRSDQRNRLAARFDETAMAPLWGLVSSVNGRDLPR